MDAEARVRPVEPQLQKALVEIAAIWRSGARDFLMMGQARPVPHAFREHPVS